MRMFHYCRFAGFYSLRKFCVPFCRRHDGAKKEMRRTLYRTARLLGDLHAIETGRVPQRLLRRFVYRHAFTAASRLCRLLGL